MAKLPIDVPEERIRDLCRAHHIHKLAIFGSALRGDFGTDSDIDVLVEFEAGHVPGLRFFAIQSELAGIFGRRVDLNTAQDLSVYTRDRILSEAEPLYVAA